MNKTTSQCIYTTATAILLPSCFALGSDRRWERRQHQEDLQEGLTTEKHTTWQRRYIWRTHARSNHFLLHDTFWSHWLRH